MDRDLIQPRPLSGFADYSEAENVALSRWMDAVTETFRLYGFSRLIPRPLEHRDVLLSRGGIQKQVFGVSRLPGDQATVLALPFDRTVPLAAWVALKAGELVFPYKRYDVSYSFRGERAQAGRFQGFFQADIDVIGLDRLDLSADAEVIAVLYEALSGLGLGSFRVFVNHIGLSKALIAAGGVPPDRTADALRVIDKLPKAGADAVLAELAPVAGGPEQARRVLDALSFEGRPQDFGAAGVLAGEAGRFLAELSEVWTGLVNSGVPEEALSFRPGVVRGLDYYSGTVFETYLVGHEGFGSVASGGRYDDLVSTFSRQRLPGVGGSIGLTRLFDAAVRSGLVPLEARTEASVFVGFRTPGERPIAQQVARALRGRGARVDLYSATGAIKKQVAYAGRKGFAAAVLVMDSAAIVVRDLARGEQVEVATVEDACERALALVRSGR